MKFSTTKKKTTLMNIVSSSVLLIVNSYFWQLFWTEPTVKIINRTYILDQQVKVYKNQCFVFVLTSFDFFNFFQQLIWLRVDNAENWNEKGNHKHNNTHRHTQIQWDQQTRRETPLVNPCLFWIKSSMSKFL